MEIPGQVSAEIDSDGPPGNFRLRSCENMISDAGVARQRWLAFAGARGQAAIACISGLTPKMLIIRFIL
jgi:hypothetical protein